MRLGTANIRNFPDMEPWKVDRDAVTCTRHTSVCGLQEIQVGEDTKVVRDALPDGWVLVGEDTTSPIIVNTASWIVADSSATRHRRPHLSRVENPFMDVVTVTLRSVKRPHLNGFAVANTHLVSGGYNAQHLRDVKAQWDVEWDVFTRAVHQLRRRGLTVFPLGDLNRPQPPRMVPRRHYQWLVPFRGQPDHVGQLVHRRSVRVMAPLTTDAVTLHSDHKLHVVSAVLENV